MAVSSTNARIHRAAIGLFASKGFHGVGIRELAQHAELSSASLYHYMGTKEALLAEIMRDCLSRLVTAARRATAGVIDPVERVGRLVALHVLAHAVRAEETAVVDNEVNSLSPQLRESIVAMRDDYERLWADAIADGGQSGSLHHDPHGVARRGLLEMCSGVARWYSVDGPMSLDELARRYAVLALRALGVTDPPAPDVDACRAVVAEIWGSTLTGSQA
ncbi:TetR/AcrR family transcriptional regulator [Haloechinothrix sp. LS1_15]|uniref:TetR/AcrR family transcriptional regulator n=1 Tax=Haloechinothrix sp. LS1_15 TaxID=2652248 RepID=UPI0029468DD2|nr:TetR/AcrR family transcriptional regulator [Haloechinothrix sp. LS1_15]MDV6014329.1 TetR/AcrR family transcriptional regulator [Haloechinothrix sp. LS1_15]